MTDFFSGKRVVVTGHKGFIGSALCAKLNEYGAHVQGVDKRDNIDILEHYQVRYLVETFKPDLMFHLAAKTEVRASFTDPHGTYRTNVFGTLNVLEACRKCRVPLVYASTDKVYGDYSGITDSYGKQWFNREDDAPFHNADLYAASKRAADDLCQDYARLYDMPIRILRCANTYGPGQRNETTLITSTITKLMRGEKPVIYQNSIGTVREWLYLDDAVEAYLLLAEECIIHPEIADIVFNVGSGERVAVAETVVKILGLMGKSFRKYNIGIKECPQIGDQGLDSTKFRKRFPQWQPTPFNEGLLRTIRWYKENVK